MFFKGLETLFEIHYEVPGNRLFHSWVLCSLRRACIPKALQKYLMF